MCRYGIPRILVTDNGTQFNNEEFRKYCEENIIESRFTSIAHPHANGKAKVANRIIIYGLKKRVKRSRNNWVDEVLLILWAYRTTCRVTTGATRIWGRGCNARRDILCVSKSGGLRS